MALTFYPHIEDADKGSILERLEVLMEGAERYKAVVLETTTNTLKPTGEVTNEPQRRMIPREQKAAFNWEEISRVLRAIRELPESTKEDKLKKAHLLTKLSEVYEVLRAAKMSKLEAVRLALISEANQLKGGASQVA